MGIAAVGIDLVHVDDVKASIRAFGERFLARVFSARERADCAGPADREAERLAARFAGKEAVMKVLRPGDDPLPWRDIEIVRRAGGALDVRLEGEAGALAARRGIGHISISVTHERAYAAAVAIAQQASNEKGVRA
jgi:holo-[acyl-carrier protein] synthase